jgi:hypothetical protein
MHKQKIIPRRLRLLLAESIGDSPVTLIHGPRQCGKTTLAKIMGKQIYIVERLQIWDSPVYIVVPRTIESTATRSLFAMWMWCKPKFPDLVAYPTFALLPVYPFRHLALAVIPRITTSIRVPARIYYD